eukprot:m.358664 g.358664  ORF g.358664 m.358664 type:complete len:352 (-) comp18221_c0_seq1:1206-2261(-)
MPNTQTTEPVVGNHGQSLRYALLLGLAKVLFVKFVLNLPCLLKALPCTLDQLFSIFVVCRNATVIELGVSILCVLEHFLSRHLCFLTLCCFLSSTFLCCFFFLLLLRSTSLKLTLALLHQGFTIHQLNNRTSFLVFETNTKVWHSVIANLIAKFQNGNILCLEGKLTDFVTNIGKLEQIRKNSILERLLFLINGESNGRTHSNKTKQCQHGCLVLGDFFDEWTLRSSTTSFFVHEVDVDIGDQISENAEHLGRVNVITKGSMSSVTRSLEACEKLCVQLVKLGKGGSGFTADNRLGIQEELIEGLFTSDSFSHCSITVVKRVAPAVQQKHEADLSCTVLFECLLDGHKVLE